MAAKFSDTFTGAAIFVLILFLFRGMLAAIHRILKYVEYNNGDKYTRKLLQEIEKKKHILINILDALLLISCVFVVFFRKNKHILTLIFSIMLMVRIVMRFLIRNEVYKTLGIKINPNTKKRIIEIGEFNGFLLNILFGVIAIYALSMIFLNK